MSPMDFPLSRRDLLKTAALAAVMPLQNQVANAFQAPAPVPQGWVVGKLTGAQALVETLIQEGTDCVFGIPGAQENELWDAMKARGLGYLLVPRILCRHDGRRRGPQHRQARRPLRRARSRSHQRPQRYRRSPAR